MRTIRFAMFLFYRYYSSGRWESVPYFHTLCSMSLLLFMHVGAMLCWTNKGDLLFGTSKDVFYIRILILLGISLLIFWRIAPEKRLQTMHLEESKIKRGGWFLVFYFVIAMAMLFLGMKYQYSY